MNRPFEEAVQHHGATVLRVCCAVLGPGADAEDAWSETFLAALQAWPQMDATTNVEAWLVRVAHRKAIDITRARSRHAIPTDELPEQISPLGNPGAEDSGVWDAVAALPERQRLAIAYHYFGGLPHAETAELIGGTPEAVRRAAADGMKRLRALYRPNTSSVSPQRPSALPRQSPPETPAQAPAQMPMSALTRTRHQQLEKGDTHV